MPDCKEDLLDDIEDIVGEGDLTGLERSMARSNTVGKRIKKGRDPKAMKIVLTEAKKKEKNLSNVEKTESLIPGTQKIWVKTWG